MSTSLTTKPLFEEPAADDYLEASISIFRWLQSGAVETADELYWPANIDQHDKTSVMGDLSLYSGILGPIIFCMQLAKATGDDAYLGKASKGAQYLINHWNDGADLVLDMGVEGSEWGPVSGSAAPAYVLNELGKITQRQDFRDFAQKIFADTALALQEENGTATWTHQPGGISYDPGIALYLLYGAQDFNRSDWLTAAKRVGDSLLQQAKEAESGRRWDSITVQGIGIKDDGEMPNFFYGTAGTAYFLAKLFQATGEQKFLDAAEAGAEYLRSVSTVADGKLMVPFCIPNAEEVHHMGMCNGFNGSIRLYYLLAEITGKQKHIEVVESMVEGILAAGAPEGHFNGYWNNMCICCGTAGIINTFAGLYAATGKQRYLELLKRTGNYALGQLTKLDGERACFYQAWTRVQPWNVDATTGYYDGNSGEAVELLEIYTVLSNNFSALRLPEDPYPLTLQDTPIF